ncbi:MAG: hypothetical protein ACREV6_06185 [Clostridium sp.]|uniref:hypothetical protein n=1 Tax=Clostridium sp. TaxID=1506 RepID=UPI003D6CF871
MKKWAKRIIFFLLLITIVLLINNTIGRLGYNREEKEEKQLTKFELEDVKEAKRLKESYGDKLFNGFSKSDIPIVVYNDKYEFLINDTSLDASFMEFDNNNSIVGEKIYIRDHKNAQAFALKIDNNWVGSMPTLYTYNKDAINAMNKEMPLVVNRLFPPQLITITRGFIPSAIVHEMMHAYFGNLNEKKLNRAEELTKIQKEYPDTDGINEKWNMEGNALYNALNAKSSEESIKYVKEFLKIRDGRRRAHKLSSEFVDLERFKEWEEGLGKYAEIKIYDFAQKDSNSSKVYNYRNNRPYWKSDFKSIRDNLGLRDVEYRFYLSGMAQAMILDNLSDKWNVNIDKDGVYLEDKLREIVMKINN